MQRKSAQVSDIFSSLFLLLFAIFILIESYRLGLGGWNSPGAGYFSFGGALILGLMSLKVLVGGLLGEGSHQETSATDSEGLRRRNVIFVIAGMVFYTFILDKVGFILSTFLLIVFFLRVVTSRRWLVTLSTALVCALGSYLIFDVLLSAELPKGLLGF